MRDARLYGSSRYASPSRHRLPSAAASSSSSPSLRASAPLPSYLSPTAASTAAAASAARVGGSGPLRGKWLDRFVALPAPVPRRGPPRSALPLLAPRTPADARALRSSRASGWCVWRDSPGRGGGAACHDRLYSLGARRREELSLKAQRHKVLAEQQQLAQCTFTPRTNRYPFAPPPRPCCAPPLPLLHPPTLATPHRQVPRRLVAD